MTMPSDLPPPLPRKHRPLVFRLFIGTLLLLVVGFIPGVYLLEKYRGRVAWRAYESDALKRGVKLNFAAYVPRPVPDSENFASVSFFNAAFRASEENQEVLDPFKLPESGSGDVPKLGDLSKQEHLDLAEWQKYFVETKFLPNVGDDAAADVLTALNQFAAPLAELREASMRPHCRFPVRWEKAYAAQVPHLGILRSVSKFYALRMAANLASGRSAAAYDDFSDGLRLLTQIKGEPSLVAGLVRIAIFVQLQNSVWSGLALRQWADSELKKIETDLARLDWLKDFQFSMNTERAGANSMIDLLVERPESLTGVIDGNYTKSWVLRLYPKGWLYRNKVRVNRFFDELTPRVDSEQRKFFTEPAASSSPHNISNQWGRFYYLFFTTMASVWEYADKRFVRAETLADQARLACALERFRLAHGNFPATMAELVPAFIPVVPGEIVNDEAYRYRLMDDGSFLLYSVGADLRDDDGVSDPKVSASQQPDWVWRYPAKE